MKKTKITDEELTTLIEEELTVPEIARRKGMNHSSIRQRLKKLNLTPIDAHKKKQAYKDEDMIRLCKEGLSQAEIARSLGLTQAAVLYGINRLQLTCASGRSKLRRFADADLLKLAQKGLTKDEIAYELDVEESTIRSHARRLGIRVPTKTEVKEKRQRDLLQQFIDEELSPSDAAKEYGIAVSTICYWENKYGITLKDGREDIGERIAQGRLHTAERAQHLLKERTKDRFRLAEGEQYVNSHQSYRFYCVEHQEIHYAPWTQIAYGNSGLKCCGEANRLLQGWDSLPECFIDQGTDTWIYLYQTSLKGFCKVGISNDVERRAMNGGRRVYAIQHDKILCHTRLQARLIEEATLWAFRGNCALPHELLNETGWSEIIQTNPEDAWRVIINLFDAYDAEESASEFCSRYMHLNPLTISQIKERCNEAGINWQSVK